MKRGRKRRVDHLQVVAYAKQHPEATQLEIAVYFQTSQGRISLILRQAGESHQNGGRLPKQPSGVSDEQHKWEVILSRLGLGVEAGLRINGHRIYYGYDPKLETRTSTKGIPNP